VVEKIRFFSVTYPLVLLDPSVPVPDPSQEDRLAHGLVVLGARGLHHLVQDHAPDQATYEGGSGVSTPAIVAKVLVMVPVSREVPVGLGSGRAGQ